MWGDDMRRWKLHEMNQRIAGNYVSGQESWSRGMPHTLSSMSTTVLTPISCTSGVNTEIAKLQDRCTKSQSLIQLYFTKPNLPWWYFATPTMYPPSQVSQLTEPWSIPTFSNWMNILLNWIKLISKFWIEFWIEFTIQEWFWIIFWILS